MPPKAKDKKVAQRSSGGRAPPQTDAEQMMDDAQAEVEDTSAALGDAAQASRVTQGLPDGLVQRRLEKSLLDKEKEKAEKEKAIKEKELLQKKLNDMQAELDIAKAKVGDVVQVENPITPSSDKVGLNLIR